jgi:hypothetical protein
MTSVFVKRPVAFRVPRIIDDKLSTTEWQLFTDEEAAYREAESKGCDYQALFVRDGTAITLSVDQVAADVIARCAKLLESMADEQDATNTKYPDHAKAYATWVDRVYQFRFAAEKIRAMTRSEPQP